MATIDDHFPKCKGKENAKMSIYSLLWVCGVDPTIPCSKRYILDEKKYEDKHFCNYVIWPKRNTKDTS